MICPDCAAASGEQNRLQHESTCPLGLADDKTSAADAAWFERHRELVDLHARP
jgi:hypothetical protein